LKRCLALLLVSQFWLVGLAQAQISIAVNPNPPLLGGSSQYSLAGVPADWIPLGYSWQYQWIGDCVSAWGSLGAVAGTAAAPVVPEPWPGTFNVRCTFTYRIYPNPPQQTTVQTTVVIAPPTGVRIVAGLNTPTPLGQSIKVQFAPQAGGQDCGPYYQGTAQELVTNKMQFGIPTPGQDDTQWNPDLGSQSTLFYHDTSPYIWDVKGQPYTPALDNWPYYNVFYSCTQQIRMAYTDPCGNVKTYMVTTQPLKFGRELTGPGMWQLIQQ
jgi:hypothetical protein